jgi:hypothetical protein
MSASRKDDQDRDQDDEDPEQEQGAIVHQTSPSIVLASVSDRSEDPVKRV